MSESGTNQPLNSGVFPDIQGAVRDRLASFSEFGGLAMILQYEGTVDTRMDEALATMTEGCRATPAAAEGGANVATVRLDGFGMITITGSPAAEESGANGSTVRLDPFGVTITAVEDVNLNAPPDGTGRRALEWAVLALRALKGWTPPGCDSPLTGWGNALTPGPSKGGRIVWKLTLKTAVELAPLRLPGE